MALQLINHTRASLVDYTVAQAAHFFPDGRDGLRPRIEAHINETLGRLERCINAVRFWKENEFNYLYSPHYCIYLYYLSNTIWRHTGDVDACTKLFLLNKALNGMDCFYEVELPDIFCLGHSTGIVLTKASYGNYLVLHQNVTVGKNHGVSPVLEEGVVLYPGSAVIGGCRVRAYTTVAQGVSIVNQDTPGHTAVFSGGGKELIFKPIKRNVIKDMFRI